MKTHIYKIRKDLEGKIEIVTTDKELVLQLLKAMQSPQPLQPQKPKWMFPKQQPSIKRTKSGYFINRGFVSYDCIKSVYKVVKETSPWILLPDIKEKLHAQFSRCYIGRALQLLAAIGKVQRLKIGRTSAYRIVEKGRSKVAQNIAILDKEALAMLQRITDENKMQKALIMQGRK